MAEASPIDVATRWQTSYLGLTEAQRRQFASDTSEVDAINELAPLELTAEAARNASSACSKLAAKEVQTGRKLRLCVRCRLSRLVLLYAARPDAVSNRWPETRTAARRERVVTRAAIPNARRSCGEHPPSPNCPPTHAQVNPRPIRRGCRDSILDGLDVLVAVCGHSCDD